MKVTTLRIPEGLYDDLVDEAESEDRSFSEYVRMLLRNRQPNTNPNTNTQANTDARLNQIEARLDELEASVGAGKSLNQQTPDTDPNLLVNDEPPDDDRDPSADDDSDDMDLPGPVSVDDNPHSQTLEKAVRWAEKHQPVRRAELEAAFADDVDIKWRSFYTRHLREALKDHGFEYDRTGGVATWEK